MRRRQGHSDSDGEAPTVECPWCHHGTLQKHCPPTNRCGWWLCDLPCGYAIDISTGRAWNRRNPQVRSPSEGA